MPDPLRILIVEDSPADAELMLVELLRGGFELVSKRVETEEELRTALAESRWDIVLSDYTIPGFGAAAALALCQEADEDLPFIVVSGTIGEERAVYMMRAGANDYVLKGSLVRLAPVVERELREAFNRRARRRAEQAASRLAAIVEWSNDAIFSEILDGTITSWNTAAQQLYGWAAAEAIGRNSSFLIPPDKAKEFADLKERLRLGEHFNHFETIRLHRDGTRIDVSITASAINDSNGRLVGISKVSRDIRERKRADEILRDHEAKLAEAVRLAQMGYWSRDLSTGKLDWSDYLHDIFGVNVATFDRSYESFLALLHADDRQRVEDRIAEAVAAVGSFDHTYRIFVRGEVRVIYEVGRVYDSEDGRPYRIAGTTQDVTDRKRAEDSLRQSEQQQRELAAQLETERARLVAAQAVAKLGSWETDLSTLAVIWSAETFRIFEADPALFQPTHQRFLQLVHPADRGTVDQAFGQSLDDRSVKMIEHRILMPDGRIKFVEERWQVVPDDHGKPSRAIGTCQDITERKQAEAARDRLGAILESTTDMVSISDPAGRLLYLNRAGRQLLGVDVHEDITKTAISDFISDPASHPIVTEGIPTAARLGAWSGDTILLNRRRDAIHVSQVILAHKTLDGEIESYSTIVRDMTERRRAEEALRTSEVEFRTLAEAVPQVVWATRPDGANIYFNKRWMDYTGLTLMESLGDGWIKPFHPDDSGPALHAWQHATKTDSTYQVECRLRRADGVYRWWLIRGEPLRDAAGDTLKWFGTCTDIDDFKQTQAERDQLLAQLEFQRERMPLAYLLSGPDFRYTCWNPAAERMFGFAQAEVLGKHPFDLIVPPQSRGLVGDILERLKGGDMNAHGVSENLTRDGRTITCQWYNTPLIDKGGAFTGMLSLAEDVTERRQLEQQLRQAQKMEAVGQLAGGVAHDFNNLLCVINGYSDLLLASLPSGGSAREYVIEIRSAGEKSAALTRQLLTFSRQQVVTPKVLDLNAIVVEMQKMLGRVIGEDVLLATSLASGLGTVRADEGQIQQVLLNLAVNARDAMPQGGRLTIETQNVELDEAYAKLHAGVAAGPYVLLAVSDSGCGMSAAVKARLFDPFFTTKGVGKGTGLGLAVVHGAVNQAGGHVAVYSEVGAGTSFKVYLPRLDRSVRAGKSSARIKVLPRGNETILLVEDDDGVRYLSLRLLKDLGYTMLEANGGAKGLRLAGQHAGPIHLLITDVVMPEMSGSQLAEKLASLHPEAQVLFMSGYTDDAVVRHGILQDNVNFLAKPFSPAALATKIREILDQRVSAPTRANTGL